MTEHLRTWARWMEERPLALSLLAIAIAAAVSVLMAHAAGFRTVRHVVEHAMLIWLVPLAAARGLSYAGYAVAHGATLTPRRRRRKRLDPAKTVAFGGAATSLEGGFAIDHRALRGVGVTPRQATVRVLNLGALELATLAPAAWLCSLTLLGAPHVQQAVAVPWVVGVPAGFILALSIAARVSRHSLARRGAVGRAIARGLEALELLTQQLRHPLRSGGAWGGMAIYWAGEIVSLWAALRMFGQHPTAAVVVLAYATGHVLTPRSLPLSGVGLTELLLPLALMWTGIVLAAAVPAVFAYRIALLALSIPPALAAHEHVQQLVKPRARERLT